MKRIVVLSGAGISAESGIATFRDSNGLWENHAIEDVATPEGWQKNPKLVLDFYNQRRAQLKTVQPNLGHKILSELETDFDVYIITQNVDNLHERAGSKNILHLHGELTAVRGEYSEHEKIHWEDDLQLGDKNKKNEQLRPAIVWFGEAVPNFDKAVEILTKADIVIVIGTSLQVYPAAGLINYVSENVFVYYIDPNPATIYDLPNPLEVISLSATKGMEIIREELRKLK